MTLEHSPQSLGGLSDLLRAHGVTEAVIKPLSRNHNDKNQVYAGSDFQPLYPMFDLEFRLRASSTSQKNGGLTRGRNIPEAVFRSFFWLDGDGREVRASGVRMIIYPQYPETRLSGFKTVENTLPKALSVEFTKQHPDVPRHLVLGRRGEGEVLAVMVVNPGLMFRTDIDALPPAPGSRVWKHLRLREAVDVLLRKELARVVERPLPGCRLDANRVMLPFNGTQVCGYTLEHALGIVPNSSSHGDFEGIELKTHTQDKVTLFTPEPDMGVYAEDFARFMTTFGYRDSDGHWRLTGIHRVDKLCPKSGLTLRIMNHERGTPIAASVDQDVHLALIGIDGRLAAGWSLDRILNCWTAKHNEAVYIRAIKTACKDPALLSAGHRFSIEFSSRVLWCRGTSAEQLFEALYNGTVFLDPAPKYCPDQPELNKRRSQWRVNDIHTAASDLYKDARTIAVGGFAAAAA